MAILLLVIEDITHIIFWGLTCLFDSVCDAKLVLINGIFHLGVGIVSVDDAFFFVSFHAMIGTLAWPLVQLVFLVEWRLDFDMLIVSIGSDGLLYFGCVIRGAVTLVEFSEWYLRKVMVAGQGCHRKNVLNK